MLSSAIVLLMTIIFLVKNKRYRWFYIVYKTYRRDLWAAFTFLRINIRLRQFERNDKTVPKLFQATLLKHPQKIALHFEDTSWTYQDLEDYSNRVANYFKGKGYKRADTVALYVSNKPEYVALWLGLSKIGVITALINTNLVAESLLHSLTVCAAKAVIFDAHLKAAVDDIAARILQVELFQLNEADEGLIDTSTELRQRLENQANSAPTEDIGVGRSQDKLLFIYTSGTTGLPKAAVITNIRFIFMSHGLARATSNEPDDVWYDPLPLYHSSGGIIGIGACLLHGNTVVIRKKFSASNFWNDCIKFNCTVAQYIGEICRYILAANHDESVKLNHCLKKIVGNGLRPQIWKQFVERFGIQNVYEFYGATEGNSNIVNVDNTIGAVGFIPRYASRIYPVTLIRCNDAGEPLRDADGLCIKCKPGQPGVFVGNTKTKSAINKFSGYADKLDSQKKLIKNVFVAGDVYFNSGDVLEQDELGNFYFKDRTGDTFRWKGENVATSEIEAVISNVIDLSDAVVYGVEIPGSEGRAGMVAVVDTNRSIDMKQLAVGLKKNLPSYSVPVFVRVMDALPMTGTYKLKKTDLQKDGFDLARVTDRLYVYDAKNVDYLELTRERFDAIMDEKMKF